jgi:MFS family permease
VTSTGRTSKVVVGIIVASTAVGALAGITTVALLALAFGALSQLLDLRVYAFAGSIGAACGAILGPAFAFGFLRRVPLWRLFAETGAATVVGAIAGLFLCRPVSPPRPPLAQWGSRPRRRASPGATAGPASQPSCRPPPNVLPP